MRPYVIAATICGLAGIAWAADATTRPACPFDGVNYMDARSCGACHGSHWTEWSGSAHSELRLQCCECHGRLHSGTLGGCKRCHEAIHKKRFENWPEVTRFDDEGGSDHVCMVCHDPHFAKLKDHMRQGCFRCHGDTYHTALSDALHRGYASWQAPIEMDTYAREKAAAGAWLKRLPSPMGLALGVGRKAGFYCLCFLAMLPVGFSISAVWGARAHRTEKTTSNH